MEVDIEVEEEGEKEKKGKNGTAFMTDTPEGIQVLIGPSNIP